MLGAPVGIEDQIRGNVRPGGLREDMYARRRPSPAHRVADDPAHGVNGRDRPGAYKLFAFLKRDVGHLTGRGLDLLEPAIGPRILQTVERRGGEGWVSTGRSRLSPFP